MNDQVVVLSANDVRRINALPGEKKVPAEVLSELDEEGFNVVAHLTPVNDGEIMRLLILLKMRDTMTPNESVIDCPLVDYLGLNRIEVVINDGEIDIV